MLPRPAHRSPFPPGLCNRTGQRAQQGKRRRHALLPTLWRRCLRGPGGHHPLLQLGHGLRDHRRHHVGLLHHHPVSAAIHPHGALTHSLNGGDEGREDARKTCQVRLQDVSELLASLNDVKPCIYSYLPSSLLPPPVHVCAVMAW